MFSWIPEEASNLAGRIDNVLLIITTVSVFFFLLISFFLIFFILKYRKKSQDEQTPYVTGNTVIEIIWTVIPTILLMIFFLWGYIEYKNSQTPPEDATEINVVAKQWLWEFEYYDGTKTINELYLQKDKPVKMIMISDDVIHSFFVPAFRVKQDVLPGNYTQLWFTPTKVGTFDMYCAEYCGIGHSKMLAKIHVLSPEAYSKWVAKETNSKDSGIESSIPPSERGKKLFSQRGCNACHSIDGSAGVGPTLKELFGKEEEMQTGEKIKVDENYLRESILFPDEKIVKGYQPVMPSFKGILSDEEITALIEYMKTLN